MLTPPNTVQTRRPVTKAPKQLFFAECLRVLSPHTPPEYLMHQCRLNAQVIAYLLPHNPAWGLFTLEDPTMLDKVTELRTGLDEEALRTSLTVSLLCELQRKYAALLDHGLQASEEQIHLFRWLLLALRVDR